MKSKEIKPYKGYESPLACFRAEYPDWNKGRTALRTEHSGMYQALNNAGQMDEAIPETLIRQGDPMDDFNEEYKGKFTTLKELRETDNSLYKRLARQGRLDETGLIRERGPNSVNHLVSTALKILEGKDPNFRNRWLEILAYFTTPADAVEFNKAS